MSERDDIEPITNDEAEDEKDETGEPETQQSLYELWGFH